MRRNRAESRRSKANRTLLSQIEVAHLNSRQTYGSIRIHRELRSQGNTAGLNRIARLKREGPQNETITGMAAGCPRTNL
ncbi:hypothetical protein CXK93_14675 [Stutzerimonas decontaminans]|uniref:HTH-like domain-containing protein n=1 Tax=Stutzerimonas decontaminans TaxID=3022791 RepID=A0ABX4VVX1_9GAMM|nr:hypothetical protein CXK93_14675 [Stutzerimonas decontaminans]